MPPNTSWTNHLNKYQIQLNDEGNGWKDLMNECLSKTEIFYKSSLNFPNVKNPHLDPNVIMNIRHKMIKTYGFSKPFSSPKEQIQAEAFKLLSNEKYKGLLKQKEEKIVKKEIDRIKKILENYQTVMKVNEVEGEKRRRFKVPSKMGNPYMKMKRPDSLEGFCEVDKRFDEDNAKVVMGTKVNQSVIPFDVKIQARKIYEEIGSHYDLTDRVSSEQKGSLVDFEVKKIDEPYLCVEDIGKKEIMLRFLTGISDEVRKTFIGSEKIKKSVIEDTLGNSGRSKEENQPCKKENKNLGKERKSLEHAWKIWRTYTALERKKKEHRKVYEEKIEAFLRRLNERDLRGENGLPKPPIPMLKHKVKERQNPTAFLSSEDFQEKQIKIEQRSQEKRDKLENLVKELEKSQKETQEILLSIEKEESKRERVKVLKTFTKGFETAEVRGKVFPTPKFLLRMEERRRQRMNSWKEIQEKKRQLKEQREEMKRRREEEMKAMEENEKRKNMEELREIRRIERERREEAKITKERLKGQLRLADSHHEKVLLRSYGLRPWMRLMMLREQQKKEAKEMSNRILVREALSNWRSNVADQMKEKIIRAEKLFHLILERGCFRTLVNAWKEAKRKYQVAVDWDELRTAEKMFKKLVTVTQTQKLENLCKEEKADAFHKKKLKLKYMKIWLSYPEMKRLETAKQKRKQIWRLKIREILPDYRPIEISDKSEQE